MQHVMLDLETLGTSAGCIILSIGAIEFNESELVDNSFYAIVDRESCTDLGLRSDDTTRNWWKQQSKEAKEIFTTTAQRPVRSVILNFVRWLQHFDLDNLCVWGNGASFDQPIITEVFRVTGWNKPWNFWNERCFRTIKSIFPIEPPKRSGTAHNALDDAVYQAEWLIEIVRQTGIKLK